MKRRQLLGVWSSLLLMIHSGCLGYFDNSASEEDDDDNGSNDRTDTHQDDDDDAMDACPEGVTPEVDIDAPTLSPGETDTVRIEGQHVETIGWRATPEDEGVVIDWHDPIKVEPPITMLLESYPPTWRFGQCADAVVELQVQIAEDTEPGEYSVEVGMSPDHQRGDWEIFEYLIRVE